MLRRQSRVGRGIENEKEEEGSYKYSAKREVCESKQHQKKERPRREKEAAMNLTTTALTLNQPHSLVLSLTALCGFRAPLNTEQGQP